MENENVAIHLHNRVVVVPSQRKKSNGEKRIIYKRKESEGKKKYWNHIMLHFIVPPKLNDFSSVNY